MKIECQLVVVLVVVVVTITVTARVSVTVTVTASVAVTCRGCNLICGTLITVVAALHFNLPRQAAQELNFFTTKCAYATWYVQ